MALKIINGVKHYPVSENIRFNLESCHDKLSNMIHDAWEAGDYDKAEQLEKTRDEADQLAFKASYGWLSGPDYGRAKELSAWRTTLRDIACANAGVPNMVG
jgi:hypothetical protein